MASRASATKKPATKKPAPKKPLTLYLATLVFRLTIPTWPTQGQWFFNPLAWQLVFVLGFTMSRVRGPGGWGMTGA